MIVQCTNVFVSLPKVDVEKLVQFYTELFGKYPVNYIPNIYGDFQVPGLGLGIFKPREKHRQEWEGKRTLNKSAAGTDC